MSSLVASEVRRLLSRRLGRWLAALTLLGIAVSALIVFFRTNPGVGDPGFRITELRSVWQGTSVPLVMLGWVMGASFLGSDWQTGTFTTTLSWEPRRLRLFTAKAATIVLVVFAGYLILQLVLGLALLPTALARGTTSGADAVWAREAAGVLLRGGVVATVGSVVGMSIAMVGRNTGAALGVGFAYIAVVEALVRGLRPGWILYLFGDNAGVFITARPDEFPQVGRSTIEAGVVLVLYALLLASAAAAVFRARDVT